MKKTVVKYAIIKNGFYLTSVFDGGKFEAVTHENAYKYNVKLIAEDVARLYAAAVVEVK